MSSRYRWRRLILQGIGLTGVTTSGACLASGVWGATQINTTRQRWFSDDFVMTPETFRMPYKAVSFHSEDGIELEGWFVEQTIRGEPSRNLVMCCNPYNNHKSSLLGIARGLWDAGYSVLLFDYRSHAKQSYPRTIGHKEYLDAKAAMEWITENVPEGKVGLVGASMGGAIALMLASHHEYAVVGCATDCAFVSLKDVLRSSMERRFYTFTKPFHYIVLEILCLFNSVWYGYDPADVGPEKVLHEVKIPLLIIHSGSDSVVPVQHAYEIYEQSATPRKDKQLIIIPGIEHIGSYFLSEKAYIRRIVDFLDTAFQESKLMLEPVEIVRNEDDQ